MEKNKMIQALLLFLIGCGGPAFGENQVRGVIMEDGNLMRVMPDGRVVLMEKEMSIGGMKVMPNGEVAMADGTGFILQGSDGMMADGMFGVLMRGGRMLKVYPGYSKNRMEPMTDDLTMLDGSRVMKSGLYRRSDSRFFRLSNGEEIEANGTIRKWGTAADEEDKALNAEWGDLFRFVEKIDPAAHTLVVTDRKGWRNELAVTPRTEIFKNGKPIWFSDIKIGDHVTYQYEGTVKNEWLGNITVLASDYHSILP